METKPQLKAEKREVFGKSLADLRESGKLPAILYGPKKENQPIFVSFLDFKKVWKAVGESTLIELDIDGKKEQVLIYDVDLDPLSHEPRHVDFYLADLTKKIIASVPLVFEGESLAVKSLGGVLVKVIHEVEVESLPKDLPSELKVDISTLKTFEDKIVIGDLKILGEVKILGEQDGVIALVEEPKEEIIEEEKPSIEDIEVTGEKPKEEDKEEEGKKPVASPEDKQAGPPSSESAGGEDKNK